MKKITKENCLQLFVVTVLAMGLTSNVVIPNVYSLSYNEQVSNQKNNMWQLGKNLEIGDSFTYKICDPSSMQNYSAESYHYFTKNLAHNSSMCYTLHLHFINHVISDENQINGNTWIVEASIIDYFSNNIRKSIFHIDANSWNVKSAYTIHPDTVRFADSLENTLFSIYKYTAQESRLLQEGIKWGEVTEYRDLMQVNPYMTVLDDGLKFEATEFVQKSFLSVNNSLEPIPRTLDVSKVGYDIDIIDDNDAAVEEEKKDNDVTNYYLVNNDLPFPVEATYYSPSHIVEPFKQYEFELISFFDVSSILENNSNNADIAVEMNDNDASDIHVESGTIELTFPDNVIDSTKDRDSDDDKIIEHNDADKNNDDYAQDQNENNYDGGTADSINTIDDKIDPKETTFSKSSLMILLSLVIGIAVIAIFVYFKKFRKTNSASYGVFGKDDDDNDTNLQTHEKKTTISFDDSITINITSISD